MANGMQVDPETLYLQLGQLVAEMPAFGHGAAVTPETNRWLGRAAHLVFQTGNIVDHVSFTSASDHLIGILAQQNAQQIQAIIYRALAFAEANAPAAARGGVVAVNQGLDALQVVGKLLAEGSKDLMIVDPYMNSVVFTDFGPTAPEGIPLRLLADSHFTREDAVRPGMERWRQQFGATRPIEVRLSAPKALHDRLIFADGAKVWSLSQSLKNFAGRSPAVAQRLDPDFAKLKIDFYEITWAAANPLT